MSDTTIPAVHLSGIRRSFGDVTAVDGLDIDIPNGATVALLGPNGAGKSTAISIMLGLLQPDAGTARTLGLAPREAVAQGRVGAMLQTSALPVAARVDELIRFARDLYPHPMPFPTVVQRAGLEPILQRTVDGLSGGEAQRVRFGFAIAGDPELVFLDEPTVGMDVESRRAFWDTMRGFAADGRTILFATHYLEEADQVADRVLIIAGGRLRADDSPAGLRTAAGSRAIRLRAPGVDPVALRALPGVRDVQVDREHITLQSDDPDRTLRAALTALPDAVDIEVHPARLEDAFVALTSGSSTTPGEAVAA